MNRFRSSYIFVAIGALSIPSVALAAFVGPTQAPPQGNVPGVIWNTAGTSLNQTGAEISIDGKAQAGSFELLQTPQINFFNDIKLESGKALRVDQSGTSDFWMGNWQGGSPQGFSFKVNGDVVVNGIGPSGAGVEGRIQADKFCFQPGAPADCITSWPTSGGGGTGDIDSVTAGTGLTGGGVTGAVSLAFDQVFGNGLYVNVTGDTMTGLLTLSGNPVNPLHAATKQYVDTAVTGMGDITGVTAGTGLTGGGTTGALNIALDQAYTDGRYVNITGDTMTGGLVVSMPAIGSLGVSVNTGSPGSTAGRFIGADNGVDARGGVFGLITKGATSIATGQNTVGTGVGISIGDRPNVGLLIADSVAQGISALSSGANSTAITGISTGSNGNGIRGDGSGTGEGGYFVHPNSTVNVAGTSGGVTATYTPNGNRGILAQQLYGVYGEGDAAGGTGVYGLGATAGGAFTNSVDTSYRGYIGYANYGGYFLAPSGGVSLRATQQVQFTGDLTVSGEIDAGSNTLTNCSWTAYVANGGAVSCPTTAPIMNSFQNNGAGTQARAYCCDL